MNKMKRTISLLLVLLLLTTGAAFGATIPTDVPGSTFEDAITTLVEKGIVTGDVDGKFHPDSTLTRAQACIMVVKAMNPQESEIKGTVTQPVDSGFSDMTGYGWAEGYIAYAVKKGVVNGYPDGTFKPANPVTMHEITAMAVRAAGFKDSQLTGTWPGKYTDKANELGFYEDLVTIQIYPLEVSKGMTAKIIFNALAKIEAANPPAVPGGGGEIPSNVPTLAGKTFATGSFNSTMTEFDGKKIASDVVVHVTGEKVDYKSTMTLSTKVSDFRTDTVYKYKNVTTPLWYAMSDGEITAMILPMDVGFSGKVYGVINGTSTMLNAEGDAVIAVKTLVAGNEITWLGTKGLAAPTEYMAGSIIQMNTRDGQIREIVYESDSTSDHFTELTSNFDYIYWEEDGLVRLDNATGELIAIKDNAAVYVLSDDQTEYTVGRHSSIRVDKGIRAYDITDDDDSSADIVVIYKEASSHS
jgi:hypothetical protein